MSPVKVLVVDDEPDILEALRLAWADEPDVSVVFAADADAALACMEAEAPDVVLTDFRMPGVDGLGLIERAKALVPGARHWLMTAFPDSSLKERAWTLGCEGFVPKPFRPDALLRRLRAA